MLIPKSRVTLSLNFHIHGDVDALAWTVECFDEIGAVIYSELSLKPARLICQESGHVQDKRNDH